MWKEALETFPTADGDLPSSCLHSDKAKKGAHPMQDVAGQQESQMQGLQGQVKESRVKLAGSTPAILPNEFEMISKKSGEQIVVTADPMLVELYGQGATHGGSVLSVDLSIAEGVELQHAQCLNSEKAVVIEGDGGNPFEQADNYNNMYFGLNDGHDLGLCENSSLTEPLLDLNLGVTEEHEELESLDNQLDLNDEMAKDVGNDGNMKPVVLIQQGDNDTRSVLGGAEKRLNREVRDQGNHKSQSRGMARLIVPLKRSLLCNPVPRPKSFHAKKVSVDSSDVAPADKRSTRAGNKSNVRLPAEEQATALLMKTCGIDEGMLHAQEGSQKLGEKFVSPMQADLVGGMRVALGLTADGGVGALDALVSDVGE